MMDNLQQPMIPPPQGAYGQQPQGAYPPQPGQAAYGQPQQGYPPQGGAPPPQNVYVYAPPQGCSGVPVYPDLKDPALQNKFISQGYKDLWAMIAFYVTLLGMTVWAVINVAGSFKVDCPNSISGSGKGYGYNCASYTSSYNCAAYGCYWSGGSCGNPPACSTHITSYNCAIGGCQWVPAEGAITVSFCQSPTLAPISGTTTGTGSLTDDLALYTPLSIVASSIFCGIALALMKYFPNSYIWIANGLCVLFYAAIAVFYVIKGFAAMAVIPGLWCAIHGLWLFCVRKRIPFAGVMLSNSVHCITSYWGTIVTSFMSIIFLVVYVCIWFCMIIPVCLKMVCDDSALLKVLFFLFIIVYFWGTQVITNVVHCTTSGTVATWYFVGEANMPGNPAMSSLKRSMTTSFGSICFGSLIVAILKAINALLRSMARRGGLAALIVMCFVKLIERLMEYFNVYAFTHVAIYGSSYIEAAKQTFELIKKCVVAAVFNDCLVWPVMELTKVVNSFAIGMIFGAICATHSSTMSAILIGLLSFLVCYVVHICVLRCVFSGIVTIFVCFAECEDVCARSNPAFYNEIKAAHELTKESTC